MNLETYLEILIMIYNGFWAFSCRFGDEEKRALRHTLAELRASKAASISLEVQRGS